MGLGSALSIGQSALLAYQSALQVVGYNIANAGTPGFARTSARLAAVPGATFSNGQVGSGVRVESIQRNVNESLQARLRLAGSDQQSAIAERTSLKTIEAFFDPLGEINLGSLLSEFFGALGELQNTPDNPATRGIVLNSAQTIVQRIREIREDLIGLRQDLNTQIEEVVVQADQIATRIAEINTQISVAEASSGGTAAALRDERDRLLTELSQYFAITVREQPSGAVNVYVGNAALVQFGLSFGVYTSTEQNSAGLNVAVVRFREDNGPVTATSGLVEGLINARDAQAGVQLDRLDTFAAALIQEVNNVHAGGQGLQGFSSLTGLTSVIDPAQPLSAVGNGVAFIPHSGSFFIDVKDAATGSVVRTQINVDLDGIGTDSTLASLAADINANVAGVTAAVLADGRLQLAAAGGSTFTFADDTSGVLAALGVNAFFGGTNALSIEVNPAVVSNPLMIAAAKFSYSGDGSNATSLARLENQAVASLGGVSLTEYYTAAMANIAVSASSAQSAVDASGIIFDSLTAQRESLSGVNLDEEAVSLISFQRAYEGAAQYMRVVDEMLQVLLGLVR